MFAQHFMSKLKFDEQINSWSSDCVKFGIDVITYLLRCTVVVLTTNLNISFALDINGLHPRKYHECQ